MAKAFIHVRRDLANLAALQAAADANKASYPAGGQYLLGDGAVVIVTGNDGTTVTLGTVTVV